MIDLLRCYLTSIMDDEEDNTTHHRNATTDGQFL